MSLSQVQQDDSCFDLEILDFRGRSQQESLRALTDLFGVSDDQARRYYQALPLTLFEGEPESAIRTYVQVLVALGADIRITRTGALESWVLVAEAETDELGGGARPTAAFACDTSDPSRFAGAVADGADDTEPVWMPTGSRDDCPPRHLEAVDPIHYIDTDLSEVLGLLEEEIARIRPTEPQEDPDVTLARTLILEQRLRGANLRSSNLRAYYPPDCSPDKHTWVDRIPTVQFFARGLKKLREAAAELKAKDDF